MSNNKRKYLIIFILLACVSLLIYKREPTTPTQLPSKDLCPTIAISPPEEVAVIKEGFNPNEPPAGEKFYVEPPDANPWTETSFDVEGNGDKERILYANVAMNHTPHLLRIVKDGFVIFKAEGANIRARAIPDGNGFLLDETLDWNTGSIKTTRYVYNKGKFIPQWYQKNCRS